MLKYSRLALGVVAFGLSIYLFVIGQITLGLLALLFSILFTLFFFRNENMLAAFFYLRKNNLEKAYQFLKRIKNPEAVLLKGQQAYYYFLVGTCESQKSIFQSEKYFKKALALGLRMDHDVAMAKLSLAGVAMSKGNKREAQTLLAEAKKLDKSKMLAEQIKMMQQQMGMVGMQKVGMQSYQGRKRM